MRVMMIDAGNQMPFYVYPLCRALATAGCAVELVTAPFIYEALPPMGLPVYEQFARLSVLPPLRRFQRLRQIARGLEYPLDWATVLDRIRKTRPDVVHVQWPMLPPVDALAFRAIRQLGARLVYTVHDIRPHYGRWRRLLLSTQRLYGLADDLIVHTEANKTELCEVARLPRSKVHVISQGNLADWSGPPVPRELARTTLALPGEAPLILFFGGIKPYKRLDMLIEAFPRILRRIPTARLVIAGRPGGDFGSYQRQIERLGVGAVVIQRLGFVPEAEVAHYFCAADVVALPYTDADFSGVLMATLNFGRPAVVTETGGIREVLADGETGYLVPPNDVGALADALIRILDDPRAGARMGERAREIAVTRHDWHASARVTMQVYGGGQRDRH